MTCGTAWPGWCPPGAGAARCSAPRGRGPGSGTRSGAPTSTPCASTTETPSCTRSCRFRPELVLHGGALTAVDLCETEVDLAYAVNAAGTRNVAEAAELVGAHVVYVSTDYVFDGTGQPALPRVGRAEPGVGLRRLEAGRRARVPARLDHRAHELGERRARGQHGGDRPAPGRRGRRAALRRRPARVAHLHRRPGAGHRHARPRPPTRRLPRHQQRRHHLVGFRAGRAGRGRWRPRAGQADHRPPSSTRPGTGPAAGQLGARQHGPAPGRPARPAGWQTDWAGWSRPSERSGAASAQTPAPATRSVAVIGAGYVGLPTAATLAHFGHSVVLAEREPSAGRAACRAHAHCRGRAWTIWSPRAWRTAGLTFTDSAVEAVAERRLRVPVRAHPPERRRSADLSYVEAAAKEIATHLQPGAIVVNKSTVPVGSATHGRAGDRPVRHHGWCPTPSSSARARRCTTASSPTGSWSGRTTPGGGHVGELFSATAAPLIVTDTTTSETIKYASNAFLATKLSFVNALAGLCEEVGADARDVLLGLGYDKRIGFEFLRPGPGWGGSCLPKDTRALLHIAERRRLRLLPAGRRHRLERRAAGPRGGQGRGRGRRHRDGATRGRLGPDLQGQHRRPARLPSLQVARRLVELGATVQAFDPTVDAEADVARGPARVELNVDPYEAVRGPGPGRADGVG